MSQVQNLLNFAMLQEGSSSASSPLKFFSMMPVSPSLGFPDSWLKELKSEERGLYLIHLLLACAKQVAASHLENANATLEQISMLASPTGDTMQRIAAYFTEALADRILKAWPGLHKAVNSTRMVMASEEILVQRLFFELFPFLKVAYILTNQAIIEAMEGEKIVHIIDLNAVEPSPWIALLQVLSTRPEGPPHLRITSVHPKKEVLDRIAHRLIEEAEKLDIPFQFNPIVSKLENLEFEKLRVKTGEALAISSVLQLHTLLTLDDAKRKSPLLSQPSNEIHLASSHPMNQTTLGDLVEKDTVNGYTRSLESISSPPASINMERFLKALWSLSPKIMVVTEQDSNHNGSTLMERLLEALYSYAALFDCLELTVPRNSLARFKVEKMLFGKEIKNIIACEGLERKERHEKLDKWFMRFDCTGFGHVPLSYFGRLQARRFLQNYGCAGYKMKEENGCAVIYWQDRSLFSVSAWKSMKT